MTSATESRDTGGATGGKPSKMSLTTQIMLAMLGGLVLGVIFNKIGSDRKSVV